MIPAKLKCYLDFLGLNWRIKKRASVWASDYIKYKNKKLEHPPIPPVLQIIPTENCNLRCPMCNQWGDNGYFITRKRTPDHMPIDKLTQFLDDYLELNPNFTLSIHGGEPFAYKDLKALLSHISKRKIDSFFSTNGTLFQNYIEDLALINEHSFYLLSIDGGEETQDKIRGKGVTQKIIKGVDLLAKRCRELGVGLPKLIINYCICEHNIQDVEGVIDLAKRLNATIVNYNFRWFLPTEKGEEYNKILQEEFNISPSNAWKGWETEHTFPDIEKALKKVYQMVHEKKRLFPPYLTMIPKDLSLDQAALFYHNYDEVFGKSSCIMPSYWARIHSNGDLIYCPGHPDIIPGNVFKTPFKDLYENEISKKLRERVENNLLPICNRCCGLYMTYPATKKLSGRL